ASPPIPVQPASTRAEPTRYERTHAGAGSGKGDPSGWPRRASHGSASALRGVRITRSARTRGILPGVRVTRTSDEAPERARAGEAPPARARTPRPVGYDPLSAATSDAPGREK